MRSILHPEFYCVAAGGNCASIPQDSLVYDLFGYESNYYPGTHSEGRPGHFELANHGTLFLDEITMLRSWGRILEKV